MAETMHFCWQNEASLHPTNVWGKMKLSDFLAELNRKTALLAK
jgi:hypothetical protein